MSAFSVGDFQSVFGSSALGVIRRRFCRGKMVKTKNLGKSVLGQVKQFGGSKTCLGGSGMFRKDFEKNLKWNFH